MNIAYFRKTKKTADEAAAAFKDGLKKRGLTLTGERKLTSGSILIQFIDESKTVAVLKEDQMLLGLIPMAALVATRDGQVSLGIINPDLLGGSGRFDAISSTVVDLGRTMRDLVNESAGVGDPKVEKVKLYSTATCPYCKMEKDYLKENGVEFDLVMVDEDRSAAEEMVRKSGQMGVPQTEVVFDSGDSELVIGFDKHQLKQLLGIK